MTECRPGAAAELGTIVESIDPATVVLFTGGASFVGSGAAATVEPMLALRGVDWIAGVRPNPTLEDVAAAVERLRRSQPGLLVAVGGGSVIDLAKAARGLTGSADLRDAVLSGSPPVIETTTPLVAVPTTAGTGSEATHFSAVYVDGVKHSVGHERFRPEHVLLDPNLTASMPPRLTAETGLDALSQAMESMWSTRSTDVSAAHAREALELAWRHLEAAVNAPTSEHRAAMCTAAHLAGRAIDTSKTTAAHALSYSMTVKHGVAHGHAVALTLGALLEFNSCVTDEDAVDPRGAAFVRERIGEVLSVMGVANGAEGRRAFEGLVQQIGLETRLASVGITTREARRAIVESVDAERLANNPRAIDGDQLMAIVDEVA